MRITATGWWGIPGRENTLAKVHAVCDWKPICGKTPHPKSQFQWCCNGLNRSFIQCEKCLKLVDQHQMSRKEAVEELARVKDNLATFEQGLARLKKRVENAERALGRDE